MINRDYKQFGKGEYFHIYNRGNAKQRVFFDDEDFSFFMLRLEQCLFPSLQKNSRSRPLPENSFSLVSYCLMPNHFHLLVSQNSEIPTSKLLLKVCTSYSIYFNRKYNRIGHVFQDRFKQVLVHSNSYLLWLSAYIHQNPTVAGLIDDPKNYQWSSYSELLGNTGKKICNSKIITGQFTGNGEYEHFVSDSFSLIKERKDIERFLLDAE